MIVPINWTNQHNDPRGPDGTTIPKYSNPYDCASTVRVQNGKFVPRPDPAGQAVDLHVRRSERADAHQDAGVHDVQTGHSDRHHADRRLTESRE